MKLLFEEKRQATRAGVTAILQHPMFAYMRSNQWTGHGRAPRRISERLGASMRSISANNEVDSKPRLSMLTPQTSDIHERVRHLGEIQPEMQGGKATHRQPDDMRLLNAEMLEHVAGILGCSQLTV